MIEVSFSPKFIRRYGALEKELGNEVYEKIELLKNSNNHTSLKVHKLKGRHSDCYSFSVNYKVRVIFEYLSKKEITLLTVGDHEIYK